MDMMKIKTSRGFTLLISVLVASILLSLGFAIYNIVSKELIFSSAGRESQFAFYAADSGVECALYWDQFGTFATTSTATTLSCADRPIEGTLVRDSSADERGDFYRTTFLFWMKNIISGPCAQVEVRKYESGQSIVSARGYNTCVEANPRRLERGIRVQY